MYAATVCGLFDVAASSWRVSRRLAAERGFDLYLRLLRINILSKVKTILSPNIKAWVCAILLNIKFHLICLYVHY